MRLIYCLLFISLSCSGFAQYNWRVSVSAGGISPEFLVKKPFGSQFEGSLYYTFSETQAGISSGYHKWEVTYGPGGNRFTAIPVLGGVRILIPQNILTLYFSGELGVYFIKREYTYEEYIPSERFPGLWSLNFSEQKEENKTKFAYRLGVGAAFTLLNNFETDVSIRYNNVSYVFITSYIPPERSNIGLTHYSFIIGLSYNF